MRILNQQNQEIQQPDLEKGYLKNESILIKHHDEIPEIPATYKRVLMLTPPFEPKQYRLEIDNPGKPKVPAWDEYEMIQRYYLYTAEELELLNRPTREDLIAEAMINYALK